MKFNPLDIGSDAMKMVENTQHEMVLMREELVAVRRILEELLKLEQKRGV